MNNQLDGKLLGGAAIFGVGWDIAGFCLAGALPDLGALNTDVIQFVAALVGGMFIARQLSGVMAARSTD
ncbi:DUF6691 family protein [uncultured Sulfitobacter sp.]|uniref:DUF6691 family protein n=1 Tax=uncultured Sulfitobacter sp. TaxID=191468 RepID=UPI00345A7DAD